uniref:CSD domain-containing protein n=1 Tax=viral metagenome TaxID=1070528 RepID=A0A6C0EJ53_9ZZZZ
MTQCLGSVKWFNNKKGFGFITNLESNDDIFVHYSGINVSDDTYKTLIDGEYVSFLEDTLEGGKKTAINVTGIQGGPLLCEHPTKKVILVNKTERSETSQ